MATQQLLRSFQQWIANELYTLDVQKKRYTNMDEAMTSVFEGKGISPDLKGPEVHRTLRFYEVFAVGDLPPATDMFYCDNYISWERASQEVLLILLSGRVVEITRYKRDDDNDNETLFSTVVDLDADSGAAHANTILREQLRLAGEDLLL